MADEDAPHGRRGFGCMILMILALLVAMMLALALPYLPELAERVLVDDREVAH